MGRLCQLHGEVPAVRAAATTRVPARAVRPAAGPAAVRPATVGGQVDRPAAAAQAPAVVRRPGRLPRRAPPGEVPEGIRRHPGALGPVARRPTPAEARVAADRFGPRMTHRLVRPEPTRPDDLPPVTCRPDRATAAAAPSPNRVATGRAAVHRPATSVPTVPAVLRPTDAPSHLTRVAVGRLRAGIAARASRRISPGCRPSRTTRTRIFSIVESGPSCVP
jgi:hypothetical protein